MGFNVRLSAVWLIGIIPWIELGTNIRSIADHTGAERPLNGQPTDDQCGNEDAGHNDGGVDCTQRHCTETIFGID